MDNDSAHAATEIDCGIDMSAVDVPNLPVTQSQVATDLFNPNEMVRFHLLRHLQAVRRL
jgi:hypothetical protein